MVMLNYQEDYRGYEIRVAVSPTTYPFYTATIVPKSRLPLPELGCIEGNDQEKVESDARALIDRILAPDDRN
jgi:hypothetical protein